MKKLSQKLHSQRGASILLAMLFLLVCMMVAASVLMAAVSNAGKIQSNYDEQQRYLALSSALRLVAGELEQAKYYGRYTVNEWTEVLTVTETDAEDKDITIHQYPYNYYNVEQETGTFSCGALASLVSDEKGDLILQSSDTVLTFRNELNGVFAGEFNGTGYRALSGDGSVAALPTNPPGSPDDPRDPSRTTRILTVKVQGGDNIENLFPPVTVEIDMTQSLRIHLKATLPTKVKDDGTIDPAGSLYIMEAELEARRMEVDPGSGAAKPAGSGMLTIDYSPEEDDRLPKAAPLNCSPDDGPNWPESIETESGTLSLNGEIATEAHTTSSYITWKLDWISREIKEA